MLFSLPDYLQASKQLSDTESVCLALFPTDQQLKFKSEGHTLSALKLPPSHISELFLQISANEHRGRDFSPPHIITWQGPSSLTHSTADNSIQKHAHTVVMRQADVQTAWPSAVSPALHSWLSLKPAKQLILVNMQMCSMHT